MPSHDDKPMSIEIDGRETTMTPSEIERMKMLDQEKPMSTLKRDEFLQGAATAGLTEAEKNAMMGLAGMGMDMAKGRMTPTMTEEERIILDSLLERGLSMDTALDIMASNKVDSMNKLGDMRAMTGAAVRPEEFGGLPKASSPAGIPSNTNMAGGGNMTQQQMTQYLANRTNEAKRAMGSMLGALGSGGAMNPTGNPTMMPNPNMRR